MMSDWVTVFLKQVSSGRLWRAIARIGAARRKTMLADLPPEWRRDLLPEDILQTIRQLGYHPFLILRTVAHDTASVKICKDQNEVEEFAAILRELADRSSFVSGLRHAISGDIYEAAFNFFDWTNSSENAVTAYIFDPSDRPFPCYYNYPIFAIGKSDSTSVAEKIEFLAAIFDAYERAAGNDRTRFLFLETLAFALSKSLGALGQYHRASQFVRRALNVQPTSLYLQICLHTLERKSRGLLTSRRLEKYVGEDLHALDHAFCPHPFTRMEIAPAGNIYCCCPDLVPSTIGNIERDSATAAMNSEQAHKIRASVLDGSYRYCNPIRCQQMIRDSLPQKTDPALLEDSLLGPVLREQNSSLNEIRELAFGYDPTCNLSCPSCRREMIIDTQKQSRSRSERVRRNIAPLLEQLRLLYINISGEFLFSRTSRELLQSIDPASCRELTIDLISNGTLFSASEWRKFANIHGRVRRVRISTDAATKETFEAVRRGGNWERFVKNVHFIGELRQRGEIQNFLLAFTYQVANFREMPMFVAFGKSVGADVVSFEPLLPSGSMTQAEYEARAIHLLAHPLRDQFLEVLKDPSLSEPWVMADWKENRAVWQQNPGSG